MPYQISVTINDKGSTRTFTPTGGVPTDMVDIPRATTTTPGPGLAGAAQAVVIDAPIIARRHRSLRSRASRCR